MSASLHRNKGRKNTELCVAKSAEMRIMRLLDQGKPLVKIFNKLIKQCVWALVSW